MLFYHLYGLHLQSTFEIPNLPETSAPEVNPDITIQWVTDGCIDDFVPQEVVQQPIALQVGRTDALVYLQNSGVYLVQGGCKIVIISTQNAPLETICQALLGVVMAILLYQRGLYILHGSTAAIDGTALAFLGDSGAGKSSALATVLAHNFEGIADDLTAVQLDPQEATVYAGLPLVKLSPEVASTLSLAESAPSIDGESRCAFPPSKNSTSFPLRHLYILEYGPDFLIDPLPRQQAIIKILQFSGLKSVINVRDAYQFKQAAQLASYINVYRLQRPYDLQQLPKLAKLLRHHMNSTHSGKYRLECVVVK